MSDFGNKKTFSENLNYYMKLYDKDRKDICNALGFKYTTVRDWVKGRTYPRIDKIEMLANYFHVQKSDLIEKKSDNTEKEELEQEIKKLKKTVSIQKIKSKYENLYNLLTNETETMENKIIASHLAIEKIIFNKQEYALFIYYKFYT